MPTLLWFRLCLALSGFIAVRDIYGERCHQTRWSFCHFFFRLSVVCRFYFTKSYDYDTPIFLFISFRFSCFYSIGWTQTTYWKWHCQYCFYRRRLRWLWFRTELHQESIYTYPFSEKKNTIYEATTQQHHEIICVVNLLFHFIEIFVYSHF